MTNECLQLVTGAVGAVVGGCFVLAGTILNHRYNLKLAKENQKRVVQGTLRALRVEAETVWEQYQDTMGNVLEGLKEGEPLNYFYPIFSEFFVLYNANAAFLGKIEDPDLQKIIVKTYAKARGLIDGFRFNNELFLKNENWKVLCAQPNGHAYQAQAIAHQINFANYGQGLKSSHIKVKQLFNELLRALDKNTQPLKNEHKS
jgi:hypothetical protein